MTENDQLEAGAEGIAAILARIAQLEGSLKEAGVDPDPIAIALRQRHPACRTIECRLDDTRGGIVAYRLSRGLCGPMTPAVRSRLDAELARWQRVRHVGPGETLSLSGFSGKTAPPATRSANRSRGKGLADTGKPESAGSRPTD